MMDCLLRGYGVKSVPGQKDIEISAPLVPLASTIQWVHWLYNVGGEIRWPRRHWTALFGGSPWQCFVLLFN